MPLLYSLTRLRIISLSRVCHHRHLPKTQNGQRLVSIREGPRRYRWVLPPALGCSPAEPSDVIVNRKLLYLKELVLEYLLRVLLAQ